MTLPADRAKRLYRSLDVLFPFPIVGAADCVKPDCEWHITARQFPRDESRCRVCADPVVDGRWNYCSERCRDIAHAVQRMFDWEQVREAVLERDDYTCRSCGISRELSRRAHWQMHERIKAWTEPLHDTDEYPNLDRWRAARRHLEDHYEMPWFADLEVDHIEPLSDGGHPFDESNLQTLCAPCHAEKTAEQNRVKADPRPEIPLDEYL